MIRQLKDATDVVRNKILQILSHVNKRLDGNGDVQLPLVDLVELFCAPDAQALMRSLALVYIEKAFPRSDPEVRLKVFPHLMKGIADRPMEQRTMLLRIGMMALEDFPLKKTTEVFKKQKTEGEREMFEFLEKPSDRKAFLEFVSWTLLFLTRERIPANLELVQNGRAVEIPLNLKPVLSAVPPGLSLQTSKTVEGKEKLTEPQLSRRKIGILNFVKEAELKEDAFLPFILASADPMESVRMTAESLLKKHFRIEKGSKDINLNDPNLISAILHLLQGSLSEGTALTQLNASGFQLPVSHGLKSKLLNVLVKSTESANHYPQNIQVTG